MAMIFELVQNRLPDEAELFSASLSDFIEEAAALAGFEGMAEKDLTTLQKSLIADMAAKAMILPAMSHYKKALAKAEGDGAGTAEFVDKLKFLTEMEAQLARDIKTKKPMVATGGDAGVPMMVVTDG